jgi:hypothetical protein
VEDLGEAASTRIGNNPISPSFLTSDVHVSEPLDLLLEEQILVGSVSLGVLLELLVLDQGHVRGQHHQSLGRAVGKLSGTAPLPPRPLLVKEQLEVVVGEGGGREGPGTIESGSICQW